MANGYLFDAWEFLESREVVQVKVVPRIEDHAGIKGCIVGLSESGELVGNLSLILCTRIRLGVELHTICAHKALCRAPHDLRPRLQLRPFGQGLHP